LSPQRLRHEVRAYVGVDLYERLVRETAARRITVAECLRRDLAAHYALRDELAEPFERDRRRSGERPLVHRLLGEMETRLAAELGTGADQRAEISAQITRVEAMIDRLYFGIMLHLAEVPDEARPARAASADERYRSWRKAVEGIAAEATAGAESLATPPVGPEAELP
jgi:hypothetical protein